MCVCVLGVGASLQFYLFILVLDGHILWYSGTTLGKVRGTIWNVGNRTRGQLHARQALYYCPCPIFFIFGRP